MITSYCEACHSNWLLSTYLVAHTVSTSQYDLGREPKKSGQKWISLCVQERMNIPLCLFECKLSMRRSFIYSFGGVALLCDTWIMMLLCHIIFTKHHRQVTDSSINESIIVTKWRPSSCSASLCLVVLCLQRVGRKIDGGGFQIFVFSVLTTCTCLILSALGSLGRRRCGQHVAVGDITGCK